MYNTEFKRVRGYFDNRKLNEKASFRRKKRFRIRYRLSGRRVSRTDFVN